MKLDILEYIKRVQALAQNGLAYCKNEFDIERYEELREISVEMISKLGDSKIEIVRELFANETGYQTPKICTRAAIFNEDKILLVREKLDGKWAMPGGWCDVGYTPAEVTKKEVWEEAGLKVEVKKLAAVLDRTKHEHPKAPYHIYIMFFLCDIIGGELKAGMEVFEAKYFSIDNLPELSIVRNTKSQVKLMFDFYKNGSLEASFD